MPSTWPPWPELPPGFSPRALVATGVLSRSAAEVDLLSVGAGGIVPGGTTRLREADWSWLSPGVMPEGWDFAAYRASVHFSPLAPPSDVVALLASARLQLNVSEMCVWSSPLSHVAGRIGLDVEEHVDGSRSTRLRYPDIGAEAWWPSPGARPIAILPERRSIRLLLRLDTSTDGPAIPLPIRVYLSGGLRGPLV